ncbi:co-chaperone YbbN [Mangrovibacterium marinum]|uniref:Thioredoxin n=1 Tax=Mangrovibacterium marinum TaxID=1639118 RepID=A0A2T5C1J6_9BACT|nr:thioredoxin family protein [Mangrovibacterium marinum]PTN08531.1 thioredoxin [Mangrovibacterium marinum]
MESFANSLHEFQQLLASNDAVLVYLSTDECQVCHVLKPKLERLLCEQFPKLRLVYISINEQPEIAGQYRVFTAPTVLVFFQGNEYLRQSRTISIEKFITDISRPYRLMFS